MSWISKPASQKNSSPKRIDVKEPPQSLTQSPFSMLRELGVPATPPAPESEPEPERARTPKKLRQRLVLRREKKGHGGKTVVVVSGFTLLSDHGEAKLLSLEKQLKQRLGCGGHVDVAKREIVIQGDRPEEVARLLHALGYEATGVTTRPPGK